MKLIKNGTIINEGRSFVGDLLLDGEFIKEIYEGEAPRGNYDEVIDASGCFVLPGVIDDHVHFRETGLRLPLWRPGRQSGSWVLRRVM